MNMRDTCTIGNDEVILTDEWRLWIQPLAGILKYYILEETVQLMRFLVRHQDEIEQAYTQHQDAIGQEATGREVDKEGTRIGDIPASDPPSPGVPSSSSTPGNCKDWLCWMVGAMTDTVCPKNRS